MHYAHITITSGFGFCLISIFSSFFRLVSESKDLFTVRPTDTLSWWLSINTHSACYA